MATWPVLTLLEVLLAFAGGFLLSRGEAHGVHAVRLALAVMVAIAITVVLMAGWWLRAIPFDIPVAN